MDEDTEREITARLDYIERYLAHLGAMSGYRYTAFALSTVVAPEVAEPARQGKTNDAIKLCRKRTHASVQQAEDVIARLRAGDQSLSGSGAESALGGSQASGEPGVPADIVAFAQSGQLVRAIKMYRARTGADLREAKAAVEQAARGYCRIGYPLPAV